MQPNLSSRNVLTAIAGLVITTGSAGAANVIVNGDFETGDFSDWSAGLGSVVSTTSPLAGSNSAVQTPTSGQALSQSFTAITAPVTTSFIFNASDPGGAGDRILNVYFGQSGASTNRVNLRIVDLNADGDGDVQVFNGAWTTVLTDAFTFGETTTLSLTFNAFGAGSTYDLNVGGNVTAGLNGFQNGTPADFGVISFVNSSQAAGSSVKFDNVSVSVIPEPSSTALLGLGMLALLRRRRL